MLNMAFTFPAFFNPIWIWEIFKQAIKYRCQLIIIRDLPLALSGILAGKILRIPTILDMAECYPEMLRCTWKFEGLKLRNIFLRNPLFADLVEYLVLRWIDHVLVMIEESKDRLLTKGLDPDKVTIVSNTPDTKRFTIGYDQIEKNEYTEKGALKLLYVGLLNPSRGIDTVIRAINEYTRYNNNFFFIVVGSGKDYRRLKGQVKTYNVDKVILFKGWIDNNKIPIIINECDICIVPHHRCSHWENTIPNKLFDYMAAGKPVIVSNVKPMERIVKEVDCGMVYQDYDVDDLVRVFRTLEDHDLRKRLGINGKRAIESRYNWRREEKALNAVINKVGG
jgi:glycosyltransferase involved in cell wall biosynthesis